MQEWQDNSLSFGWWEGVYQDFKALALQFGLTVDLSRTCFSGFYHEQCGCSYAAEIDVKQLLAGVKKLCLSTNYSSSIMTLPELPTNPEIIKQLEAGLIGTQGHVRPLKCKTRIYVAMEFQYPPKIKNHRALDEQIELFIDSVIELCDELNGWLFTRLLRTYEHLVCGKVP